MATFRLLMVAGVVLLAGAWAVAQEQEQKPKAFSYQPPKRGLPSLRQSGGARGPGQNLPRLRVLTPEQAGITHQHQPVFHWFQSAPARGTYIFTLNNEATLETLVELRVLRTGTEGIHRIDLGALGVQLDPDVLYTWSVGLTGDEAHSSEDPFAAGGIMLVTPPDDFRARLTAARAIDQAQMYAQAGVWYDALTQLSAQIDASPKDADLRRLRADLLEAVGLSDVAAWDRQQAAASSGPQ